MNNTQYPHPKFSVITVTYNAGKVLEDTIQSVVFQTYRNVEYIIVDGNSKDNTLEIVDKYRNRISLEMLQDTVFILEKILVH